MNRPMIPEIQPDITVNRKALRQLLVKSFNDEELKNFCFDYFPEVYEQTQEGSFGKHVIARLLIEHCERYGLLKQLLPLLKTHNPYQYSLHEPALFEPESLPQPDQGQPRVTLKLTFPNIDLEKFTPDKQAVLIHLIAEELNIAAADIEILDIRQGSTIIILRLPAAAARQLIALFYAQGPIIKDLDLGYVERMRVNPTWWDRIIHRLSRWLGYTNLFIVVSLMLTLLLGVGLLPLPTTLSQEGRASRPIALSTPGWRTPTPAMLSPFTAIPPTEPFTASSTLVRAATSLSTPVTTAPAMTHEPGPAPTSTLVRPPQSTPSPRASSEPIEVFPTPTDSPPPTPTLDEVAAGQENLVAVETVARVVPGQHFLVRVSIKHLVSPGVFGSQFKLIYNPELLEAITISPNAELLVVKGSFDNERGVVDFAASRQADVPNFTQDVVFVELIFKAKNLEQPTPAQFQLNEVKLGAKGGLEVPAAIQGATVVIAAE